jgi:4-amino-4-deoxy-L-arabinose transferase-like glycosyltransferase
MGAFGMLASLLRANLAGAAFAAWLTIILITIRKRRFGTAALSAVGAVVGAAIAGAPVLVWLARGGALGAFWNQAVAFNLLYSHADWFQRAIAAVAGVWLATSTAPVVFPALGLWLAARRLRHQHKRDVTDVVLCFAVLWICVELLLASLSGRAYDHYFIMLLPPMAMLTAVLVSEGTPLWPMTVKRRLGRPAFAAAVVVVVAFRPVVSRLVDRARAGDVLPSHTTSQTELTAAFVRASSGPDDHLLVWGQAGGVYFLAERLPASRYLFASPLLTRGYGDLAATEFLADVRRTKPLLIVDAGETDASAPSLAAWDPAWRYPDSRWYAPHRVVTPSLQAFYEFVAKNYTAIAIVGPERWTVYRANPPRRR